MKPLTLALGILARAARGAIVPTTYTHFDPDHPPVPLAKVWRWAVADRLRGRRKIAPPGPPAPQAAPDLALLAERTEAPRLTWLGHSACLVQMAGKNVLIDPVLCRSVGGYRRHGAPGLLPDRLPPVDVILVSHSHYDHLDAWTLRRIPRSASVVVPLGLGDFFRKLGYRLVNELAWWDEIDLGKLAVRVVPARHWSRRTPWDTNTSLWCGFVLNGGGATVYHAGDTAQSPFFAQIRRTCPRIDAAFLPIGAYEPAWFMEYHHMNPEQALDAFVELGARRFVPIHWGAFQLTDEALRAPAEWLARAWAERRPEGELWQLAVGESRSLPAP